MKLVRRTTRRLTILLIQAEKNLLLNLLDLYPLIPPAFYQLTRTGKTREADQKLLDEAMAEQREQNRQAVQDLKKKRWRFRTTPKGIRLSLSPEELEFVLQVLNDVRVGAWLALGEPDESNPPEVTDSTAPYFFAMESAGAFQSELLHALGIRNPPGIEIRDERSNDSI